MKRMTDPPGYSYQESMIILGECAQIMADHVPDNQVDLVVTSPPYGQVRYYEGFLYDFHAVADQLIRVLKPGGVIVWVENDQVINGSESGDSFRHALYFMDGGLKLHDTMIFNRNSVKFPDPTRYHQVFEYMFIFSKGKPQTINLIKDHKKIHTNPREKSRVKRYDQRGQLEYDDRFKNSDTGTKLSVRFNIWTYGVGKGGSTKDSFAFEHPAIFPEKLAEDHIRTWSNPGNLVMDPFLGSGTTGKMARQNGRDFLGIEISRKYLEIAKRRIEGAQPPLFT